VDAIALVTGRPVAASVTRTETAQAPSTGRQSGCCPGGCRLAHAASRMVSARRLLMASCEVPSVRSPRVRDNPRRKNRMDVAAIIGRALDCRQQPNGSHLSCERLARRRKACWTKLRAKLLRDPPRKRGP